MLRPMPARGRTVLVTGGSGFIGSHVVDALRAAGHEPVIYDARSPTEPDHADIAAVRGNLDDLDRLTAAMHNCDAVVHLAAAADVNEVEASPVDAETRNSRGTLHVLEAARECGSVRVLYASTIWVYSDTPAALHDESLPLQPPAHFYSATKLAGELYCRAYQELYGVEFTILRFGIPYGPRARPAAVVPAFVSRALAGERLKIAGDGLQSRRFVYVEDLAEGVVSALAPVAANRTYNLVSEQDTTIREIAETVSQIVGGVEIEHMPGRNGDFAGAPVSADRAATELGWRASTPFGEGVRRYVDWYRAAADARTRPQARYSPSTLLRRAALALAGAAATAALLLGIVTLAPVEENLGVYDTFTSALIVLLPLVLAGGFEWDVARSRWLRPALWSAACVCLLGAVVPWPDPIHDLTSHHTAVLALVAISAAMAARLPGGRPPLQTWLASVGG
jgi:UDP-glucose 4-epimerase